MKPLLSLLACLFVFGASLHAQDITAAERQRATAYLEKTRDALLDATSGLSDAQLRFKPAPDRWSVAEVVEHVAATETYLMTMVREKAMSAPARAEPVDLEEIDTLILTRIPDRSGKVQAPEPLVPRDRFGSPADARQAFATERAKTLQFLAETSGLRGHALDSPLGHQLDPYQWILFVGAHSERHTKQIEEVKAHADFPAE